MKLRPKIWKRVARGGIALFFWGKSACAAAAVLTYRIDRESEHPRTTQALWLVFISAYYSISRSDVCLSSFPFSNSFSSPVAAGLLACPRILKLNCRSAQNIFKGHLTQRCQCIPARTRDDLKRFQTNAKSGCGGGKKYWLDCAQSLDLEDDENGGLSYKNKPLKQGAAGTTATAARKASGATITPVPPISCSSNGSSKVAAAPVLSGPSTSLSPAATAVGPPPAAQAPTPSVSSSSATQASLVNAPHKEGDTEAKGN